MSDQTQGTEPSLPLSTALWIIVATIVLLMGIPMLCAPGSSLYLGRDDSRPARTQPTTVPTLAELQEVARVKVTSDPKGQPLPNYVEFSFLQADQEVALEDLEFSLDRHDPGLQRPTLAEIAMLKVDDSFLNQYPFQRIQPGPVRGENVTILYYRCNDAQAVTVDQLVSTHCLVVMVHRRSRSMDL